MAELEVGVAGGQMKVAGVGVGVGVGALPTCSEETNWPPALRRDARLIRNVSIASAVATPHLSSGGEGVH